jgi:hypothetical protein
MVTPDGDDGDHHKYDYNDGQSSPPPAPPQYQY